MFKQLQKIDKNPKLYKYYTAETMWNDKHILKKMLELHLNPDIEPASRNHAFIEKSIDWITTHFNVQADYKVADFGCGPGLYTNRFAENGATVVGIDFSERSLRYAKRQANIKGISTINYLKQNYLECKLDQKFDLIILIYCDLCVLSPEQRKSLLQIFNQHLENEGVLFFDVFSISAFNQRQETIKFEHLLLDGFWSENDYYGFLKTIKYNDEKVILDKYTIIEAYKEWGIYNWLQYYSKKSLAKELLENNFYIDEFYSDVAGTTFDNDSDTIAIVAKKNEY